MGSRFCPPSRWPFVLLATVVVLAASPAPGCVGDCDGDGDVTVDEIVIGVNIALGAASIDACPDFDPGGDGEVTVDEILRGTAAALDGCPVPTPDATTVVPSPTPTPEPDPSATPTPSSSPTASPTATLVPTEPPLPTGTPTHSPTHSPTPTASATPTATESPTFTLSPTRSPTPTVTTPPTSTMSPSRTATPTFTPLPTSTPTRAVTPTFTPSSTPTPTATATVTPASVPGLAQRVAGLVVDSTDVFLALPSLLVTVGTLPSLGIDTGGLALELSCPGGGTFSYSCRSRMAPPAIPPEHRLSFAGCVLAGDGGGSLTTDGVIEATGAAGDVCTFASGPLAFAIDSLNLVSVIGSVATTVEIANWSGALDAEGGTGNCDVDAVAAELTGDLQTSTVADGVTTAGAGIAFAATTVALDVTVCDADGVPADYTLTVDGAASLAAGEGSVAVEFDAWAFHAVLASPATEITVGGGIASTCLGTPASIVTEAALQLGSDAACPDAGQIAVTAAAGTDRVKFEAGAVSIDVGGDGGVDDFLADCRSPVADQCPAG